MTLNTQIGSEIGTNFCQLCCLSPTWSSLSSYAEQDGFGVENESDVLGFIAERRPSHERRVGLFRMWWDSENGVGAMWPAMGWEGVDSPGTRTPRRHWATGMQTRRRRSPGVRMRRLQSSGAQMRGSRHPTCRLEDVSPTGGFAVPFLGLMSRKS